MRVRRRRAPESAVGTRPPEPVRPLDATDRLDPLLFLGDLPPAVAAHDPADVLRWAEADRPDLVLSEEEARARRTERERRQREPFLAISGGGSLDGLPDGLTASARSNRSERRTDVHEALGFGPGGLSSF
jgi:hypothetical protein